MNSLSYVVIAVILLPAVSALSITNLDGGSVREYDVSTRPFNLAGTAYQPNWYLFPYWGNSWFEALDVGQVKDAYAFGSGTYTVDKSLVFQEDDIRYAFLYDTQTNTYVQIYGTGTDASVVNTIDFSDVGRYPVMWVYPKKDISRYLYVKIRPEHMPSISAFTMKPGWNYLFLVPEMAGKTMDAWQGTCTIEQFAGWNDEISQWEVYPLDEFSESISASTSTEIMGAPFAVKVSNACTLHTQTVTGPPGLPS